MFKGRKYYDIGELLSRNGIINFVVGPRGNGKTYGAKKWAIKDFLKNGKQFIYLRRYSNELKNVSSFFNDIREEFPDVDMRVNGHTAQISNSIDKDGKQEWRTAGYFIALSVSQQVKSVPFPDVNKILFDEFILDSGFVRYLNDDVRAFLDFMVTVDRFREVPVRAVLMANSTSINNPYFAYFDIRVPTDGEFFRTANGKVVAQFPASKDYVKSAKTSGLGALIGGSRYNDYALGNVFFDNTNLLLGKKGPNSVCYFAVDTGPGVSENSSGSSQVRTALCAWNEPPPAQSIWTVEAGTPPVGVPVFTTDVQQVDSDRPLARASDYPLSLLVRAYRQGTIRFDSQRSRNEFIKVVNL